MNFALTIPKLLRWGAWLVVAVMLLAACGGGETVVEVAEPVGGAETAAEPAADSPAEPQEPDPAAAVEAGWLTPFAAAGGFQPASGRFETESGLFSVDVFGDLAAASADESGDTVFFIDSAAHALAAGFNLETGDSQPVEENLEAYAAILPAGLQSGGIIADYTLDMENAEEYEGVFYVPFSFNAEDLEYGEGEAAVFADGSQVLVFVLFAEAYDPAAGAWQALIDSYAAGDAYAGAPDEDDDPQAAAEDAPEQALDSSGADSGFQPEMDGFAFENYGEGYENLTAVEMERMFGSQVCASRTAEGCILTPPAQKWMEQTNGYMIGGHCEGMAVLSALIYYGVVDPQSLGADSIQALDLEEEALQREIAYWWTTQSTRPASAVRVNESPAAIVAALEETFAQGKDAQEWWSLGLYKRDFTGGHAITPFAVEDQGDGIYHVLVYDNNFPGETRTMVIDVNENTWEYEASVNPAVESELYEGDAETQTLEIVAISPRLEEQYCDFCENTSAARGGYGLAKPDPGFYEVWLQGGSNLLLVDDQGRRTGYDAGDFVNEIPGANTDAYKFISMYTLDKEPVYRVPVGTSFEILVDGSVLEEAESSEVTLIGPGYYLAVDDIWLEPGEVDAISVNIDGDRHQLTYQTDYAESPVIMMGIETEFADYAFIVQATDIPGLEDTFDVAIDLAENDFILNASGNSSPITFDFVVIRIDENGQHAFGGEGLVMDPENTLYLNYLEQIAGGTLMQANFDLENDGQIDETVDLVDMGAEFFDEE